MKKYYISLFFILFISILNLNANNSYAYSISELENYLNYYKSEVDNGSTEFGNSYAIQQLYSLYANHYEQFLILNERLSNCINPVYRINYNGTNHNIYYKLMDCTSLSIDNNGGIVATYTYYNALTDSRGVGNFGSAQSGTNGSETIGKLYNIVYSSNLVDSNIITTLNSSDDYISQKQWTFIVNRGGTSPIYTNNNQNINVFDIRIGQDWNINNVTLKIYVLNNNSKEYRNNITYTLDNATNSNQYIVRFDVSNLDNDNTYYIELYYNNNLWRDTITGQRIIKNVSPLPPFSGDSSGNIIVDLTTTNNKIDNVANKVEEQTNFLKDFYNNLFTMSSGDFEDIYNNILDEYQANFSSGDTPLMLYSELYDIWSNHSGDFVISWDNIPINLTFFNGVSLVSGDLIGSGEVNFSALARDNYTINLIKTWVNILLSMSLCIVLVVEVFHLHLKMLGVGASYYNDQDENEKEVLETITDSYSVNKQTGDIKESNWIRHTFTKRR